jgi:hypothetical protein
MAENDNDHHDDDDGLATLTEAVKSRILDRVLADLRADLALGSRRHGYTKSDSGIYGKYQKQDGDLTAVLEAIKAQTEQLLAEYMRAGAADAERSDDGKPKK